MTDQPHRGLHRPRICFIHIPKCGGTSIFNALRRRVPQSRIRQLQIGAARRAAEIIGRGLDYRSDILAYHLCEDVDVVFGHYQVTAALIDAHPEYEFVTILRDPVTRFVSNFYYNKTRHEWSNLYQGTLEQFLEGPPELAEALGNTYVRLLGFSNPYDQAAIEGAKLTLDRFALVGLTEKMDAFVQAFRRRYDIDIEVSRDNAGTYPERLSPWTLDRIRQYCTPDIAIYERARSY